MKKIKYLVLIAILLPIILFLYAYKIEPYQLSVDKVHLGDQGIKVVQFSDTHIKNSFSEKELLKVVDTINEQNADLVIFSGDLHDNYAMYNNDEMVINALSQIDAPHKISIYGNRDYGGGAVRRFSNIMEESGFELFKNEHKEITFNDKQILISGLDDALLGDPFLTETQNNYDYKILLSHEPDVVDEYKDFNYNIMIAAHSHGGQVKLQLLPSVNKRALATTLLSDKYSNGLYDLEDSKIDKIYVNSGIGTTRILMRFRVKPKIAVFSI